VLTAARQTENHELFILPAAAGKPQRHDPLHPLRFLLASLRQLPGFGWARDGFAAGADSTCSRRSKRESWPLDATVAGISIPAGC